MLRLSTAFIRPGMQLAKDLCSSEGQIILVAGVILQEKQIEILQKWGMESVYVNNPVLELPEIGEAIGEQSRKLVTKTLDQLFVSAEKLKVFSLADQHKKLVKNVIRDILNNKQVLVHLTQISRHQDDALTHAVNVAVLSSINAIAMGIYKDEELYQLNIGALLHDIGKVFIPTKFKDIKPLSSEELEILQSHCNYGFEILKKAENIPLVSAHVAFQHHENFDGKGYPRGLAGEDIHLFARIVAIANEFDNLVASGMMMHEAYEKIAAGAGTSFDREILTAFLTKIALYPVGTFVRLTHGLIGVVTKVTAKVQHRPCVKVIADKEGKLFPSPFEIDLTDNKYLTLFVQSVLSEEETVKLIESNKLLSQYI